MSAVISIGIDPTIELGPVTLAWHGLTIAMGVLIGGLAVAHDARRRGLDTAPIYAIGMILVVGALVGGRVYYLAEHGQLDDPGAWFGTRGFTFYGGFIAAGLGIAGYLWRCRLSIAYLDAVAVGLSLGIAVGRIGDVINGEHYGPPTDFFLGVLNTHPDALTPSPEVAYHSGGLYELLIASIVFGMVWALRLRLRATAAVWLVLALLAAGRFVECFVRSDSDTLALGLQTAQWTSLALLAAATIGAWWTLGSIPRAEARRQLLVALSVVRGSAGRTRSASPPSSSREPFPHPVGRSKAEVDAETMADHQRWDGSEWASGANGLVARPTTPSPSEGWGMSSSRSCTNAATWRLD